MDTSQWSLKMYLSRPSSNRFALFSAAYPFLQVKQHWVRQTNAFLNPLLFPSLSDWQTLSPDTSPAPSACPSAPSCLHQVTSCPKINCRLCSTGRAWTSVARSASRAAQAWPRVTWRWRPMSAGTRRCRCTTAGGRSGSPAPSPSTSYQRDEGNICRGPVGPTDRMRTMRVFACCWGECAKI